MLMKPCLGIVVVLASILGSQSVGAVGETEESINAPEESTLLPSESWRSPMACGVASCYLMLRHFQLDIKYRQVARLVPITDRGSRLSDMDFACRALGLETMIVQAADATGDCPLPAIFHLDSELPPFVGHYVLVLSLDEDHDVVRLVDSQNGANPESMSRSEFLRRWSGYALIKRPTFMLRGLSEWCFLVLVICAAGVIWREWLQRKKLACVAVVLFLLPVLEGCSRTASESVGSAISSETEIAEIPIVTFREFPIVAEKTTQDLGIITPTETKSVEFVICNSGEAMAEIQLSPPTCVCTTAQLSKHTLNPNEKATITLGMRGLKQIGVSHGSVQLLVKGFEEGLAFQIEGFSLGLRFPNYQWVVRANRDLKLQGEFFAASKEVAEQLKLVASVTTEDPLIESLGVQLGEVRVVNPVHGIFSRDIELTVRVIPGRLIVDDTLERILLTEPKRAGQSSVELSMEVVVMADIPSAKQ